MFKQEPESLESHMRRWEGKQITFPQFPLFNLCKKSFASAVQLSHTTTEESSHVHTHTYSHTRTHTQASSLKKCVSYVVGHASLNDLPMPFLSCKCLMVRGFRREYPSLYPSTFSLSFSPSLPLFFPQFLSFMISYFADLAVAFVERVIVCATAEEA